MPKTKWLGLLLLSFLLVSYVYADRVQDKRKLGPVTFRQGYSPDAMVSDEVLVKFKPAITAKELGQYNATMKVQASSKQQAISSFYKVTGASVKKQYKSGWETLKIPAGKKPLDVIKQYKNNPLVEYIEPNYIVHAAALSTTYTANGAFNDPYYTDGHTQWWVNRTQTDRAKQANPSISGTSDIVVAVVDTGVDLTHPDLAGRWVTGYNVITPSAQPMDDNEYIYDEYGYPSVHVKGHGTHVAGMIAAIANNSQGIAGAAWASHIKIMPVKVLSYTGGGSIDDLAAGIDWAANSIAAIINLSVEFQATSEPSILTDAINNAVAKGCLVVASAGNQNTDISSSPYTYPAIYSNVFTVGGTTSDDFVAWYSNFSFTPGLLDCTAPGGQMDDFSVSFQRDGGVTSTARDGGYSAVAGTSFAAPQAAGLAAMLKLQLPSRTWTDIKTIITNTCDLYPGLSTIYQGAGRINAYRALAAYAPPTDTPTITPTFTKTPTRTPSFTITPTATRSVTYTGTPTYTPTSTVTPTATESATYTVTPTSTITSTFTASPTITVTYTVTPTSTPHILPRAELIAYPQPAQGRINLAFNSQGSCTVKVTLYNMTGERVLQMTAQPAYNNGVSMVTMNTPSLASGVYIIRARIDDAKGTRTMSKKVAIAR